MNKLKIIFKILLTFMLFFLISCLVFVIIGFLTKLLLYFIDNENKYIFIYTIVVVSIDFILSLMFGYKATKYLMKL